MSDPQLCERDKQPNKMDGVKWEALAWLAFAGFAYWVLQGFDRPSVHFDLGAAFWPKVIVAVLFMSGVILLISRFFPQSRKIDAEHIAYIEETPDDAAQFSWRLVAIAIVPLIWTLAMHKMGFLLVTPFFLVAFTWLMGVRKWSTILTYSLIFYSLLVVVFYKLIFTSLPMGGGFFNTINGELIGLIQ